MKPLAHKFVTIGMLAMSTLIVAQPPNGPIQFEVASIKPSNPSAPRPGRLGAVPIVTNPGKLTTRNATLKDLIKAAYGLEDYQVSGDPAWIASARFDIEAKSVAIATRDQLLQMLQPLLAERFKLAGHRETKQLAIYTLVLANKGPKFQPLKASEASCWPGCAGAPAKTNHMRQKDLPSLARFLTRLSPDRPVVDKTGLQGYFALELDMSQIVEDAASAAAAPTNASMFDATVIAIQEQLGLKLVPTKAPIEIFVIDRAEKPSEN
jgi:uncharacterized protein (TIGR03435 family)